MREQTEFVREQIRTLDEENTLCILVDGLIPEIIRRVEKMHTPDMRPVINATGTVLHTNLGRAPISREHMARLAEVACGYSNLEYDLEAGRRGERYSHFEKLLCRITGLRLHGGEQQCLGGDADFKFYGKRRRSCCIQRRACGDRRQVSDSGCDGAKRCETCGVGTTNKTHYSDYADAVTEETKAFLKVHTSNYRIVGFTDPWESTS